MGRRCDATETRGGTATTLLARLLEGAPTETQAEAAAANPALAAVLGGQNPQQAIVSGGFAMPTNSQGVPWNAGYIVASGNLLADFRHNVAAEAQGRLQVARLIGMTDDPGVKETLSFALARDTFHQQQWLLGIERLIEDGHTDGLEDSRKDEEASEQASVFYSFHEGSTAHEGRWAQGSTLVGDEQIRFEEGRALKDDVQELPAPDPLLFATYDGSKGPGKPGTAGGAYAQGAENLLHKAKEKLTPGERPSASRSPSSSSAPRTSTSVSACSGRPSRSSSSCGAGAASRTTTRTPPVRRRTPRCSGTAATRSPS